MGLANAGGAQRGRPSAPQPPHTAHHPSHSPEFRPYPGCGWGLGASSLVVMGQVCGGRDVGGPWVLVGLSELEAGARAGGKHRSARPASGAVLTPTGLAPRSLLRGRPAPAGPWPHLGLSRALPGPPTGALWQVALQLGARQSCCSHTLSSCSSSLLGTIPEAHCVDTDTGKLEKQGLWQG